MSSLAEIEPMVLKKKNFKDLYFFAILLLSPFAKRFGPSFEQTLIHITKNALYHVWLN